MKKITEISVLDYEEQMEAIFGKELTPFLKTNPFAYNPSVGYYEDNKIKLNIGIVFNTPTGKDTKVYPHRLISIKEDTISGECNWVANDNTPKKALDKILDVTSTFNFIFIGTPLKANYDRGIKYLVVSSGSGNTPCYKLELEDL